MAYGGWKWWQVRQFELTRGEAIPAGAIGPPLTEFELTERSGKPFRSIDMRGNVWVASYFFTTCPGQCLRLNANHPSAECRAGLERCHVGQHHVRSGHRYARSTCESTPIACKADPERWLFCRGDLDYVKRVAKGMNVYLSLKGHQDVAIVIDKTGKDPRHVRRHERESVQSAAG